MSIKALRGTLIDKIIQYFAICNSYAGDAVVKVKVRGLSAGITNVQVSFTVSFFKSDSINLFL